MSISKKPLNPDDFPVNAEKISALTKTKPVAKKISGQPDLVTSGSRAGVCLLLSRRRRRGAGPPAIRRVGRHLSTGVLQRIESRGEVSGGRLSMLRFVWLTIIRAGAEITARLPRSPPIFGGSLSFTSTARCERRSQLRISRSCGHARFVGVRRRRRLCRTARDSPGELRAEQKYLSAVICP